MNHSPETDGGARCRAAWLAGIATLLLASCGGGLSGTGDGGDHVVESTGPVGTGIVDADSSVDEPADTLVDGSEPAGEDASEEAVTAPLSIAFENSLPVVESEAALLVLANATTRPVDFGLDDAPLRDLAPEAFTVPIAFAPGRDRLAFSSIEPASNASLEPFDVVAGSVTTVIWRDDGDGRVPLPLVTEVATTDPTLARVRVALGSAPRGSTVGRWRLEPVDGALGTAAETGSDDPLALATDYIDIQPGRYRPSRADLASEMNVSTADVELARGRTYTLVIGDTRQLLIDDSRSDDTRAAR